jgi:triosephosphate isomerase
MRRKIIAGNWKLHKRTGESIRLVIELKVRTVYIQHTEIVVCPTFLALSQVKDCLKESRIKLGAQNLFWEDEGAYTGEVSGPLLKDAGCEHVIIGHSERRQYFGENDEGINKRLVAALNAGLKPIVCVGETLQEREDGRTFEIVSTQLSGALAGIRPDQLDHLVIAYEPVWAIGTGKNATPEQAQDVHRFIREKISTILTSSLASTIRIQYGGSVKPANANDLLSQTDIDGALVGGASLDAESFSEIIKSSESLFY